MTHRTDLTSTRRLLAGLLATLVAVSLTTACRSTKQTSSSAPAATSPDTWAVVDGTAITKNDVEKAFRETTDPAQSLSQEEALTARLGVLDDLITEQILLGRAKKQNVTVSEADIDAAYANAKQNMSDEEFQKQLSARNMTVADLRENLKRRVSAQKVVDGEVGAKIVITDQQVNDFFNANRQQFNLPEDAFHLAQIVVTPVREPQPTNRTGDDAASPEAVNAKIAMLMDRLGKGTPFADLARDYSEDPDSSPRGGDLGLVPLSAVQRAPAPLRDAVLQTAPGKARTVTQNGVRTIVFVVSKEPAGQRDLSTPGVRQQITDGLRSRREQLLRTAFLAAARTDAHVENNLAHAVIKSQGMAPVAGK
jgi:peptidyl-prolyl cis-trans isomerase SurA